MNTIKDCIIQICKKKIKKSLNSIVNLQFKKLTCLILIFLTTLYSFSYAQDIGEELILGIISLKTNKIDPWSPMDKDMVSIYSAVYEGLVEMDDNFRPIPRLAESWEVSSNGERWTFNLRKDVFFSDGTPFTAKDVAATLTYFLDIFNDDFTGEKGYYNNLKYFIKNFKVESDYSISIVTNRSNYSFLFAMTFPILPHNWESRDGIPLGTGAYMIENFVPQSAVFMTINPYWRNLDPKIKYITCILHPSEKELLYSYENNAVDAIFTRSISAAQYSNSLTSFSINYRSNQLETIMFNNNAFEFKDSRVRKAFRHAININLIASQVYSGMVSRTDTPIHSGTWMYNEDGLINYEYDLEKARTLLTEAGWIDSDEDGVLDTIVDGKLRKLRVRLLVYDEPDNTLRSDVALIIKSILSEINVEVAIEYESFQKVAEKLKAGNYDFALVSYEMDPTPDPGFMLIPGNVGNYSYYRSENMRELFNKLRKTTDANEYQRILFDIQHQFSQDVPFICMYYRSGTILTKDMFTIVTDVRELELLRGIEENR